MTSPLYQLIDASLRCVWCASPIGTCEHWIHCGCGWYAPTGHHCRNPIHAIERANREAAAAVSSSIIADVGRYYPEPLRAASGGFRRTLRVSIEREVAAMLDAYEAAAGTPQPVANAPAHDGAEADLWVRDRVTDEVRRYVDCRLMGGVWRHKRHLRAPWEPVETNVQTITHWLQRPTPPAASKEAA